MTPASLVGTLENRGGSEPNVAPTSNETGPSAPEPVSLPSGVRSSFRSAGSGRVGCFFVPNRLHVLEVVAHASGQSLPGPALARDFHRRLAIRVRSARRSTPRRGATVPAAVFGTARLSTLSSDRRHVRAIPAHQFPSLTPRHTSFVRRPLVSSALRVRCAPALAGDLSLAVGVHRRKSALALPRSRHRRLPQLGSHIRDPQIPQRHASASTILSFRTGTLQSGASHGPRRRTRSLSFARGLTWCSIHSRKRPCRWLMDLVLMPPSSRRRGG
jgi:hypothetical protein